MQHPFEIKGKSIVITGGSGALGGSMARHLIAQGAKVAILDLRLELARKRVDELTRTGGTAIAIEANVLDKEMLNQARDKILEEWGRD